MNEKERGHVVLSPEHANERDDADHKDDGLVGWPANWQKTAKTRAEEIEKDRRLRQG